jgi:hypothetical protein
MPEIRGNKAIEDAAIAWVIERERAVGRQPRDTRYRGAPADIESPPRLIEVKAFGKSGRGSDLPLEVRQFEEARANPNFYVYVVDHVAQGDPSNFTLKVLGNEQLARLLGRAKEQRYYAVPWPVAEYDSAPTQLDSTNPDEVSPAPPRLPPRSEASVVIDDLHVFRSDESGYLCWVAEHPSGYVVNAGKSPKASYLKLHSASCTWMSGRGAPGAFTERDYIKICSTSLQVLRSWAGGEVGGTLDSGCSCT